MYAIVDCDNCYVSCERVFRPDLRTTPIVVLSNNDGCVVARSNEAKKLGIKAGMPYFKLREQFSESQVVAFSSNYELYADITQRVMSIVKSSAPTFYRYSIDEAFCDLSGMDYTDLKSWGEQLHEKVMRSTGMPVSIGIAPTKTLAKMASHYAKKYKGYKHCCVIDDEHKRRRALELYEVDEVWGVGRRVAPQLHQQGVHTAYDLSCRSRDWVKRHFALPLERTWCELNGIDCVPNEEYAPKKSICTSRSFAHNIKHFDEVRTLVSKFAARCSEKLRKQGSVAATVSIFLSTNHFREDLAQYDNSCKKLLLTPTNSTQAIVSAAIDCLRAVWREGYEYKRAGVIVYDISSADSIQTDLFDYDSEVYRKRRELDAVVDKINKINGAETVVLASEQLRSESESDRSANTAGTKKSEPIKTLTFKDAIRHDLRSPNYTTRWSDILSVGQTED